MLTSAVAVIGRRAPITAAGHFAAALNYAQSLMTFLLALLALEVTKIVDKKWVLLKMIVFLNLAQTSDCGNF